MMIAAIYARKSTEQYGVADEQKSVARQIEHARAYATEKGWTVDEHVFEDDEVSGAEFAARPRFVRLLNALKPRPPFDILIVSELSRLGREQLETGYAVKQLSQAGVKIWSYLDRREVLVDTPTDKFLMSAVNFAAEIEREKTRQRTHDAMIRKARAGHATGGRVFGYDNIEILRTDGKRSHVERRINEQEAAIVRRIFELSAAGVGLTRLAKTLNAESALAPRAQQGRPIAWAPSSVRDVVLRLLYRGEIVWNTTMKRDRWGQAHAANRAVADWIRVEAPALAIVPPALWHDAQRRFAERRAKHTTTGHRELDIDSAYLLSGFARCAVCGGGLAVHSRTHGSKGSRRQVRFYACTSHVKRGESVCSNRLVGRVEVVDAEVLATLQDDICRPAVVEEAIRLALEALAPDRQEAARAKLEAELADARRECARLAEAIGRGGPLEALVERLAARQAHAATLEGELARQARPTVPSSPEKLESRLRAKLADWRGLLQRNVQDARAVLRTLLVGPLRFTPMDTDRRRGYEFAGLVALDRLIAGVIDFPLRTRAEVASPTAPTPSCKPCFSIGIDFSDVLKVA